MNSTTMKKAFTLVEILIVVIILGILAAIVIPQFTEASNDARTSSLQSDLQTARSQLELYKVQHQDRYPNVAADGTNDASTANFVARLTGRTDATGALNANGLFGPYLQKMPSNQFVASGVSQNVLFGTTVIAKGDDTTGWYFNTATGQFVANDSQKDTNGNQHTSY